MRLRIFLLDIAWWLLLPIAWPAWAVCCLYSEIGNRRAALAVRLERDQAALKATMDFLRSAGLR